MSDDKKIPERLRIETTLKTFDADTGELYQEDESKDLEGIIRFEFFNSSDDEHSADAVKCSMVGNVRAIVAAEAVFTLFEQMPNGIEVLSVAAGIRAKASREGATKIEVDVNGMLRQIFGQ